MRDLLHQPELKGCIKVSSLPINNWRVCELLTINEAMSVTRLSRATINRRIADGSLATVHLGRAVRVRVSSLLKLIEPEQKAA
jgi:excisionase family DNA binding protein